MRRDPQDYCVTLLSIQNGAVDVSLPDRARPTPEEKPFILSSLLWIALTSPEIYRHCSVCKDTCAVMPDTKKFIENLSGAGKSIGVLTSGGDAQGIAYFSFNRPIRMSRVLVYSCSQWQIDLFPALGYTSKRSQCNRC